MFQAHSEHPECGMRVCVCSDAMRKTQSFQFQFVGNKDNVSVTTNTMYRKCVLQIEMTRKQYNVYFSHYQLAATHVSERVPITMCNCHLFELCIGVFEGGGRDIHQYNSEQGNRMQTMDIIGAIGAQHKCPKYKSV